MTTRPIELAYGPDPLQRIDLHLHPTPTSVPLVLYVHGGGFQRGDKRDDSIRIRRLVEAGLNVASINYRLAPAVRYPAPVEDVRSAVAHLRRVGGEQGIDTRHIGAIGASAGGYLVSAATVRPSSQEEAVQATSVWFATSDLVESTRRSKLEERITPVTYERALLGDDADADAWRAASPARWDLRDAPPMLLVHGDSDRIVPRVQSAMLHDALVRHDVDSMFVRIGAAGHEDSAFDEPPLLSMVAGWMRAHLREDRSE